MRAASRRMKARASRTDPSRRRFAPPQGEVCSRQPPFLPRPRSNARPGILQPSLSPARLGLPRSRQQKEGTGAPLGAIGLPFASRFREAGTLRRSSSAVFRLGTVLPGTGYKAASGGHRRPMPRPRTGISPAQASPRPATEGGGAYVTPRTVA